jgi:predicted metal-dependent hydrolase
VIDCSAGAVKVKIRRSRRARRYSLRVLTPSEGAVLTVPPRGTLSGARRFLYRHRDWLEERLADLPPPRLIAAGTRIPLRGVKHRIAHRPDRRGTVWIENDGVEPVLAVAGGRDHLRRRVVDYLKRQARRDIEAAVARHSVKLRRRPTSIRLRDPRSRWGSCSVEGALSFSWRLVMAPAYVLDYLAAHEVAHLKEMNHGPQFWRLVERLCPRTPDAEAWLKQHGPTLHAVVVETGPRRAAD